MCRRDAQEGCAASSGRDPGEPASISAQVGNQVDSGVSLPRPPPLHPFVAVTSHLSEGVDIMSGKLNPLANRRRRIVSAVVLALGLVVGVAATFFGRARIAAEPGRTPSPGS